MSLRMRCAAGVVGYLSPVGTAYFDGMDLTQFAEAAKIL
jgi:hypothetical protein